MNAEVKKERRPWGIKHCLWLVVLGGYAGYFGYLLFSGALEDLVSPRMTVFVVIGFASLLLFFVVRLLDLLRRAPQSPMKSGFALFIAPFVFIPFGLNPGSALASIGSGISLEQGAPRIDLTTKLQKAVNPFLPKPKPKPVPKHGPIPLQGPIVLDEKNYYGAYEELYSNPTAFAGRSVTISGYIYHASKGQLLVARDLMWCCAADAVTIGFITSSAQAVGLKNAEWVSVTGTLSTTSYVDEYTQVSSTVPLVKAVHLTRLKEPDFVFAYPS